MTKEYPKYRDEILKMMFVAGEVREPSVDTTTAVENIVRDQTTQMLIVAGELAARRGQAKSTANDVLFQVRYDPGRLARLRNYMRWKQIRNKAEVKDDEAADNIDMDEINGSVKDEDGRNDAEATGPVESDSDSSTSQLIKPGREKSRDLGTSIPPLPWSVLSMFQIAQGIPALRSLDDDDDGGSSEVSALLGSTTNPWLFARLIKNDERTRDMTAEEYATWAECRTASFTYRKKKTFREWCRLGVIADHRAKDDIPEILGFLTSEWVQTLTEQALAVKEQETKSMECEMAWRGVGVKRRFDNTGPFSLPYGEEREDERDTKHETSPTKSPIQPRHVRRAFEILQTPPKKCTAMRNGTQLMRRKRLRIF